MESEASALHVLGDNYGRMGDYGKAMAYLGQALEIASELGGDRIGLTVVHETLHTFYQIVTTSVELQLQNPSILQEACERWHKNTSMCLAG